MLQSSLVRRALSSRLRLQHLKKVWFQRRDADISSRTDLHVPSKYAGSMYVSVNCLFFVSLTFNLRWGQVDFVPIFDSSLEEPSLLPARISNLLLNGSSGIAVGMATNIPPHNLEELVDALSVLIHNPDAWVFLLTSELLEYMPGADFPTRGIIMGNLGILDAYRTGKGRVIVRGKTEIEVSNSKSKSSAIIVKEIPYQTNKSSLVMKIAELIQNKTLDGISDIRDESDRSGMRVVIELNKGSDPSIGLNNLYRFTALQSSFSCNMVGMRIVIE
ncbi:DNA gyrase subunit A, chloroplastic/mitochondrial, partial [Tanacetum coccineum]